jgi:hypothetical protein
MFASRALTRLFAAASRWYLMMVASLASMMQ